MMKFFTSFIRELLDEGHTIEIACSDIDTLPFCYREWGCTVHPLGWKRSPFRRENIEAVKELQNIIQENSYDIVHCHTPIASVCTRIACRKIRKHGLSVIYTVHGFHFYRGAPLKNWLLYFPAEWICSFWTDILITINQEDYAFLCKHLHPGRAEYIPGIGIDMQKFSSERLSKEEREEKRKELGVSSDEKMILSVGELNNNKNHISAIQALIRLQEKKWKYYICGEGKENKILQNFIRDMNLTGQVYLLGYRSDIADLCVCADLFLFPSFREGLSVSVMEAIATKIPVACSRIRGNIELTEDGLFDPHDVGDIHRVVEDLLYHSTPEEIKVITEKNFENLQKFNIDIVNDKLSRIYQSVVRKNKFGNIYS